MQSKQGTNCLKTAVFEFSENLLLLCGFHGNCNQDNMLCVRVYGVPPYLVHTSSSQLEIKPAEWEYLYMMNVLKNAILTTSGAIMLPWQQELYICINCGVIVFYPEHLGTQKNRNQWSPDMH